MSRIGKKPINIPEGVEIKIQDKQVTVKGPKGELKLNLISKIKVEIKDNQVIVNPADPNPKKLTAQKAYWGLFRALIANMVEGVTKGYSKVLEVKGLGFQATIQGDQLVLKLGFSHLVNITKPEDLEIEVKSNIITISGINKEKVGNFAAKIRKIKKPEPYKGKGIRYQGEYVRRKLGKKATK